MTETSIPQLTDVWPCQLRRSLSAPYFLCQELNRDKHAYFIEGKTRRLWEVGELNSEDVVYIHKNSTWLMKIAEARKMHLQLQKCETVLIWETDKCGIEYLNFLAMLTKTWGVHTSFKFRKRRKKRLRATFWIQLSNWILQPAGERRRSILEHIQIQLNTYFNPEAKFPLGCVTAVHRKYGDPWDK